MPQAATPEQVLRSHVPNGFTSACVTASIALEGSQAAVQCSPGGSISEADYILFDGNESMNSVYDGQLANFPDADR